MTKKNTLSTLFGKIKNWLDWKLFLLVVYGLIIRFLYLKDGVVSFTFDHGKDSLAVLHMVTTLSPKMIGPWTSIPGLYFGPGWYYLLAPFMWLFQFQPISAVIPMVILVLIQVVLAKRYFGLWPALIMVTTPAWLLISKSAWNPFPMTFISFILLIIFAQWRETKKVTPSNSLLAGFVSGLGFHFSTAFAIYYLPITLILVLVKRFKISIRSILLYLLGWLLPFLPQLLFEFKHNFVQLRAVAHYMTQPGGGSEFSLHKVGDVISSTISETKLAILPELWPEWLSAIVGFIILALVIYQVWKGWQKQDSVMMYWILVTAIFFGVSIIGYSFLHFNLWYLIGLFPVLTVLVGQALSRMKYYLQILIALLYLVAPGIGLTKFYLQEKPVLTNQSDFLPAQVRVIDKVYQLADGRPFSSYHYIPAIYDFAYQYLYFQRAYAAGSSLPVDFSYEPNVPEYYQGKAEIISALAQTQPSAVAYQNRQPEIIFYIIEKPKDASYLQSWWGRQQFSQITGEYQMTDEITIYTAKP